MKKFKLLSLLLIISLFAAVLPVPALALDTPELWAQSAVIMDAVSGEVLFQINGTRSVDAGNLTRLMTVLLVSDAIQRQDISLDDAVTASDTFGYNFTADSFFASPAIVPGETLTVKDLLYLSLFQVAEDASNILAEYVGGTVEAFVESMNTRAAELGCVNTHFSNANGVLAADNYTSAGDVALMAQAVFADETLRGILSDASYTTDPTEFNEPRTVANINGQQIDGNSARYEYATVGVLGSSVQDGNILGLDIAEEGLYNEMRVIVVALDCPDVDSRYSDAVTMFKWIFDNFSYRVLLSSTDILTTIPVQMGNPGEVSVRAETPVRIIRPADQQIGEITYEVSYQHEKEGKALVAPIEVGTYLGEVTVYMNGVPYGTSRLVAGAAVDISRMEYLQSQMSVLSQTESVRQIIKVLIIVFCIYLLLVCIYLFQRVRHMHSLRKARRERSRTRAQQEVEWLDIPAEDGQGPAAGYIPQPAMAPAEEPPADGGQYPGESEPSDEGQYVDENPYVDQGQYADQGPYADPEERAAEGQYADEGQYPDGQDGYYDDEPPRR